MCTADFMAGIEGYEKGLYRPEQQRQQRGGAAHATALDTPGAANLKAAHGTDYPVQIHLSVAGPDALSVMWATGKAKTGQGGLTPNDPLSVPSVVRWGTAPDALTNSVAGTATVSPKPTTLCFAAARLVSATA